MVELKRHPLGETVTSSGSMKNRSEDIGFLIGQVRNVNHMTLGFHDQRPHAKRTDAVFDNPSRAMMNDSSRNRDPATGEITGEAIVHGLGVYK